MPVVIALAALPTLLTYPLFLAGGTTITALIVAGGIAFALLESAADYCRRIIYGNDHWRHRQALIERRRVRRALREAKAGARRAAHLPIPELHQAHIREGNAAPNTRTRRTSRPCPERAT